MKEKNEKLIVCLMIILLAACSSPGKKMQSDTEYTADDDDAFSLTEEPELYDHVQSNPVITSYSITASSELPDYPVHNLLDRTWKSWSEGVAGNGIGESFTFAGESKTVAGFALKNGYGDLNYYSLNNRVKSFKIYADGNYTATILIKDSINFEQYIFEEPITVETLRFVIDDVYQGTQFDDTCIAEIALLSQPVNAAQFHWSILVWLGGRKSPFQNNIFPLASVSDTDELLLMEYFPFDIPYNKYYDYDAQEWLPRKTKIALLDGESSLKLEHNLPRLDGATAMYPLYSSFVHAVYPETDIDLEHVNRYHNPLDEWAYYPYNLNSLVQCRKTSRSFERLIDGETDIIFCYAPSEAEKNAAAEKGKRFNLTPIAHDAFVFIVNKKSNLNTITQRQIRDIYSGRITNWKSISGIDEPVIAYQRPENSGSQTTLQSMMRGRPIMQPILDGIYRDTMAGMVEAISSAYYNYHSAIGYTFLFYLTQMAGDSGVKALAVDGVAPTRETIQNKRYPFTQTVYAITTGNESENTQKFIAWILSAQGQELVTKTGYTPIK